MKDRLQESIWKFVSEVMESKPIHEVEDFEKIVNFVLESLDGEIQKGVIFPYIGLVPFSLENIKGFKDRIPKSLDSGYNIVGMSFGGPYFLKIGLKSGEIKKLLKAIDYHVSEMQKRVDNLEGALHTISNMIELEVLPDEDFDGDRVYFAKGKVIVPRKQRYSVLDISLKNPSANYEPIILGGGSPIGPIGDIGAMREDMGDVRSVFIGLPEEDDSEESKKVYLSKVGFANSIDEAIEKYVNKKAIETIAVAKNTEGFHLEGAVIPILADKYSAGLFGN